MRSRPHDYKSQYDPKDPLSCLFRRGTPPECGSSQSRLLVEEGLSRSIAVDAVGYGRNAYVLYDQTLARNAGIGRLYNQTLLQLSHAALRGTSNASLLALRQRFLSPRQQL